METTMNRIDLQYIDMVKRVYEEGEKRETRNATTISTFGESFVFDLQYGFPILQCRKIYHKGIEAEFKGFLVDAKTVKMFKHLGCNYWDKWANDDGELVLDYPPREQLDTVIDLLKTDPTNRRIMINLWDHKNLDNLSLPCCHYNYQFYVRDNTFLDMIWTQRSVDIAVGLPSDLVLAALYIITIANEVDLKPGTCTMNFGDSHIYLDHVYDLMKIRDFESNIPSNPVSYELSSTTKNFIPGDLVLPNYKPLGPVKFSLHG